MQLTAQIRVSPHVYDERLFAFLAGFSWCGRVDRCVAQRLPDRCGIGRLGRYRKYRSSAITASGAAAGVDVDHRAAHGNASGVDLDKAAPSDQRQLSSRFQHDLDAAIKMDFLPRINELPSANLDVLIHPNRQVIIGLRLNLAIFINGVVFFGLELCVAVLLNRVVAFVAHPNLRSCSMFSSQSRWACR